ncbi:Aspartyl-tRNA synthetase, partial [Trachipleistophora hominis]
VTFTCTCGLWFFIFNRSVQPLRMTEKVQDVLIEIDEIREQHLGNEIEVHGFVESMKNFPKFGFLTLRAGVCRLQCVFNLGGKVDEEHFTQICGVSLESYVRITGVLKKAHKPIKSCSVSKYELEVSELEVLSAAGSLPFDLKDINVYKKGVPNVSFNKRLDYRVLDLRGTMSQSIFRIIDQIMFTFRTFLRNEKFVEIKTPKLLGSASEGGANLFEVNFFKKKAYLAQSPQLYKQMAIIGNLRRVYEIGHVYRAEESNINRYLSEFIGLDLEMESTDYLKTIRMIYSMLCAIIRDVYENNRQDVENLRKYNDFEDLRFEDEPLILSHRECVDILKEHGEDIKYEDDFSRFMEKRLGTIIAETKKIDFFVVKDYPTRNRPFYTATCADPFYSKSYDFILRGEEILSGAQRINSYEQLRQSAINNGIDPVSIEGYLGAFKYGAPPHAGCGIGLERFAKALFGSSDIRCFNIFPRDPGRLYP